MDNGDANNKQEINKGHKWQPGESGNPKGRPPKGNSLTEVMREFLDTKVTGQETTYRDLFIRKVYRMAMDGDSDSAMRLIWNYIDGMPTQRTELTGVDGSKLEPLVIIKNDNTSQPVADNGLERQP